MRASRELRPRGVFLNVPFDEPYEPLFVALISVLVALGQIPHCVLEIPEIGEGRQTRLLELMKSCSLSIHDLSRVGLPVRFNMPFELGIAFTLSRVKGVHHFAVLEAERYRLLKTLSDMNGIDPGIHGGTMTGVISCILSGLGESHGNPSPEGVGRICRGVWKTVPALKRKHGRSTIYFRAIFYELVEVAIKLTEKEGLVAE
jgi:hypothetical protein